MKVKISQSLITALLLISSILVAMFTDIKLGSCEEVNSTVNEILVDTNNKEFTYKINSLAIKTSDKYTTFDIDKLNKFDKSTIFIANNYMEISDKAGGNSIYIDKRKQFNVYRPYLLSENPTSVDEALDYYKYKKFDARVNINESDDRNNVAFLNSYNNSSIMIQSKKFSKKAIITNIKDIDKTIRQSKKFDGTVIKIHSIGDINLTKLLGDRIEVYMNTNGIAVYNNNNSKELFSIFGVINNEHDIHPEDLLETNLKYIYKVQNNDKALAIVKDNKIYCLYFHNKDIKGKVLNELNIDSGNESVNKIQDVIIKE